MGRLGRRVPRTGVTSYIPTLRPIAALPCLCSETASNIVERDADRRGGMGSLVGIPRRVWEGNKRVRCGVTGVCVATARVDDSETSLVEELSLSLEAPLLAPRCVDIIRTNIGSFPQNELHRHRVLQPASD